MTNLTLATTAGNLLTCTCAMLLFVMMFDHMTAPKYVGIAILIVALAMISYRALLSRPRSISLPLWLPLGAWALWTLASITWSVDPPATFHAWLDEIVYPVSAFYAFWTLGRRRPADQRPLQISLWTACLILAVMSAAYFNDLDPAALKPDLMHFYARVGHTSTLALMAISLFAVMAAETRTRWPGLAGVFFCVVIGGASLNRFFWVAFTVVAVTLLWPQRERGRVKAFATLGLVVAGAVLAMGVGNRLRIGNQNPAVPIARHASLMQDTHAAPLAVTLDARSAIRLAEPSGSVAASPLTRTGFAQLRSLSSVDRAMQADTRPMIWRFYIGRMVTHPWFGIGFGKPLPALAYGFLVPPDLVSRDANVLTHAHNIFLNTLLQVGVVGLALQLVVFWCLGYRFFRAREAHPWIYRAGLALLLGMLTKNLTDDFMWQSTMLMFWALAGWLLGLCDLRSNEPDDRQASSPRSGATSSAT